MITERELNKMDACRHLLPNPGPEVAGQLIVEIRRLRETLAWIAGQQNLFFAECSQAEGIIARTKEALAPNAEDTATASMEQPKTPKAARSMEQLAQISKEVREHGGEPEAKLCAKCNWEHMSRTAVIRCWGDPRTWT